MMICYRYRKLHSQLVAATSGKYTKLLDQVLIYLLAAFLASPFVCLALPAY